MSKTQCLIFLIKSVPSTALPISLHSNSIILLAEAKILTSLLHSSLILIVFFIQSTRKSCGLYLQSISWIHLLPTTSTGTILVQATLIIPLTVDSQCSSQGDTRKCKSSYVLCMKHLQWLTFSLMAKAKYLYSNPQGLMIWSPLPLSSSLIALSHDHLIPATQASLLSILRLF